MIEFDEYKVKLNGIKPSLIELGEALKLPEIKAEIAALMAETEKDGFWNDVQAAQKNQQKTKQLQRKLENYQKLEGTWEDLFTLCEMALEENDESLLGEIQ